MNNNDSQTYLDSYIICCIISFLNQGEIFILYETSNYFKNFIDTHNFLKKCPLVQNGLLKTWIFYGHTFFGFFLEMRPLCSQVLFGDFFSN